MPEHLSSYLLERIKDEPLDEEESRDQEDPEFRRFLKHVSREILESRLTMSRNRPLLAFEAALAGSRAWMLDDHLTRSLLKQIPSLVRKTLQLPPEGVEHAPDHVRRYMKEATRSYIFGHWISSIALARSTLEMSLQERVQNAGITTRLELHALISEAAQLRPLDGHHLDLAGQTSFQHTCGA